MKAIILTKSRMDAHGASGVCTTAFDIENNRIVRFVSNEEGGPIPNPQNRKYECLDLVSVDVKKACPLGPQKENLLVDINSFSVVEKHSGNIAEIYKKSRETLKKDKLFMSDREHKLESADGYNHSVEIVHSYNFTINKNKYNSIVAQPNIGYSKYFRVTADISSFNFDNGPIIIDDCYLIVSIPSSNYFSEKTNKYEGYFKFIAEIYKP